MENPARNLPAAPAPISPTLSKRATQTQIGGQLFHGDERTLLTLMYEAGAEEVEVAPGKVLTLQGHDLARMYVNKALKVVFQVIGLRPEQEPSPELFKVLNRHVCQAFPHFRVLDVYEAFIQAVAGTFLAPFTHYGQVDMPYFVSVWRAYDRYAYPHTAVEAPPLRVQRHPAQEYLRHRLENSVVTKDLLLQTYVRVLKGGHAGLILLPDAQWYLLRDLGFAQVTLAEWEATYEQAAELVVVQKNRNASPLQRVTLAGVRAHHSTSIRMEAFRLLVAAAMMQMVADGIELRMLESELARVEYLNPVELLELWPR